MSVHNVTSIPNAVNPQRQGAVIHSVATLQEHKVHYGVQSATFVRTVFPGQASGTYRLNGTIPTWQGPQYTASGTLASGTLASKHPSGWSSGRSAGSPPVPYPPRNASAYYSPPQTRIVPNPCYTCYNKYG